MQDVEVKESIAVDRYGTYLFEEQVDVLLGKLLLGERVRQEF